MFEQRIAKHALNNVLEISKLILTVFLKKNKKKKNLSLCSHKTGHQAP